VNRTQGQDGVPLLSWPATLETAMTEKLIAARAAAGVRYRAAIAELHLAYTDLAALELAMGGASNTKTFAGLCHPEFAPGRGNDGTATPPYCADSWREQILGAATSYRKSLKE
jgi:hypothetical protein